MAQSKDNGTPHSGPRHDTIFHMEHPKVSTRLAIDQKRRLDRLLKKRAQHFNEFLVDCLDVMERQLPADGERVRLDIPEDHAQRATMACQWFVGNWDQLSQAAKAAAEPLDILQYRRAWGQWQDSVDFFEGILREYQRRARHATGQTGRPPGN